jgi:Tfp pilus assembly protein PilO
MIEKTNWFQLQPLYQYLRQQAENKKFLKYLEIGATFSLVAIFLLTAIAPTASAISSLLGEIKSKELTTNSMKQKILNILTAQENYSAVQEKYQVLESSYPTSQEFYNSASSFSSISKESSTSLKQIKFDLTDDKLKQSTNYSFGVNLTADGSYASIMEMIKKVTQGRRLVDIKSIKISQNNDNNSNSSNNLDLNLSTSLFYSPINLNEKN